MDVVGLGKVDDFVRRHPECRQEVGELVRELQAAKFEKPEDVGKSHPSAKVLDGRTVVFKVRGNKFRLSVTVAYNVQVIVVLALETHKEYDRRTLRGGPENRK